MTVTGVGPAAPAAAGYDARDTKDESDGKTEFRLLGPVEIHDGHRGAHIVPPGSKQRALLSIFVVLADQMISTDRLIEELWGEQTPSNAANALQAHVGRLRKLLPSRGGPCAPDHEWITTWPSGYLLSLGPATTDVQHFHRLSAQGRAAIATDPGHATELLRRALSLWRGPALQDSRYGPLCTAEADRLEENRLTTLETLYEASLRSAQHGEITGELEKLTADHPLHERFYDLLMVALYRCGRQAEALGVYERARHRLVKAIGVEPGPALRGRMEAILNHHPGLAALSPPPLELTPPPPPGLSGEIARLQRRIVELTGEQQALARRFDALVAGLPGTP
ncbi:MULTISPECIES: AfsR/SARP family transcriptional regulator [unclassified Streptomyces]|uniref:AfsR/SARP family transcriptional regulator n=1 Tax=unclassified Streptomyces TaxID=2593676 RepID=UPI002DD94BBC|nr:AfsR/SARP family transcriptional regulator [Streptomyces sp. NBC_01750]WSA98266.1 AfsR/SARP family transcriptional regulator [Streptomyces sp. NBC_01794]WSD37196.1 AfsR/SARP family transcriptional regulator [Streptomyces sp. NBC_01750]